MQQKHLPTLYQQAVDNGEINYDANQAKAVEVLQRVFVQVQQPAEKAWFGLGKSMPVKGAYLYGSVGTGKTFLMDLFYKNLPVKKKLRSHFYKFMEMIHAKLKPLQGKKNPLKIVAKQIAEQARVICFDEFFVVNIVDAMLLGNLLTALYDEGITLLATSNVVPDDLYKGGLQYEQFVPAIHLLDQHCEVVRVDSGIDYRKEQFDYDRAYFYPQDPEMKEMLLSRFKQLGGSKLSFKQTIAIDERPVKTEYLAKQAVWFTLPNLCGIPRSQRDYLWLSENYQTVFLSGLRCIEKHENDLISNFIKLVDVFYDVSTHLIILANVPIDDIYHGGRHEFAFERTKSRLLEMQTKGYLEGSAS